MDERPPGASQAQTNPVLTITSQMGHLTNQRKNWLRADLCIGCIQVGGSGFRLAWVLDISPVYVVVDPCCHGTF